MKLTTRSLTTNSIAPFFFRNPKSASNLKWVPQFQPCWVKFRVALSKGSARFTHSSSSPAIQSVVDSKLQIVEETIEKMVYSSRFFAILAVWGLLIGSFLCFIKGCTYVTASFQAYFASRAKVILLLVEAIDIYLLGTVMLVFGMGLYELFISNLDKSKSTSEEKSPYQSNLFGIFTLKERPRWLEVKTVSGMKTKVGHVIVMLLLIGLFEKKKDLRVDGKYCYMPGSSAFGLGIAALTCLFIAQFIGNFLIICSRKFCSRDKIEKMSCNKVEKKKHILVGLFLTLSWMSFGIVIILLGAATSMNKNQHFGEGWLNGECYIVKDGVYTGSSILVLVTLSSILGSTIMKLRKRNQVEQDANVPQQLVLQ